MVVVDVLDVEALVVVDDASVLEVVVASVVVVEVEVIVVVGSTSAGSLVTTPFASN